MSLSISRIFLYAAISFGISYFGVGLWKRWAYHFKIRRAEKRALDKAKGIVPVLLPKEYYTPEYYKSKKSVAPARKSSLDFIGKYKIYVCDALFACYPKYLPYKKLDELIERLGMDRYQLEKVIYYCVEFGIIEMKKRRLGCFKLKDDIYFSIKGTQVSRSYDQKRRHVGATLAVAQRGTDRPKRAGASPAPTT